MRIRIVAVALLFCALPALAALQYEFVQKNTTDDKIAPNTDLTGRATIDGTRSRIDIIGGTVYPPGTYVISNDASQRLYFVDPSKQWYTEFNAAGVATSLGASNIQIENIKSSFDLQQDRPVLLTIETEHSRLRLSYDITVTKKTIPVRAHVETDIESWNTSKFGDVLASSVAAIASSGDTEIDQLLRAETSKLRGFPLRQTITTRTTFLLPGRSKLDVPTTRTTIRETWVTAIQETPPNAALFSIPKTYRRADTPDVPAAATQVLTFDPPAK